MNIHPYHRDHSKTRTPTCTSNQLINVLLALYIYIFCVSYSNVVQPFASFFLWQQNQCRIGESMGPPEGTVVIGESMPLSY